MAIDETIAELEAAVANTKFKRLLLICEGLFGKSRVSGGHHIFKTPWAGDPRLNLQSERGNAKPYQVRQVLKALKKLKEKG